MTGHWDCYAHAGTHRYVAVRDLLHEMDGCGISQAVLVPFLDAPGFDDLLYAVCEMPMRFRALCRVDIAAGPIDSSQVDMLLARGFCGARLALPTVDAYDEGVVALLQALDRQEKVLLVHAPDGIGLYADQLCEWVEQYPRMRVLVPHLGWPRTAVGVPTAGWLDALRALSTQPRIFVGLSALYFFSRQEPPFTDTYNFVKSVLESFGPERCVLAGDYPMALERCTYAQVWESLGAAVGEPAALAQMWDETPQLLWGEGAP